MKLLLFALLLVLPARGQDAAPVNIRLLAFPRSPDPGPVELQLGGTTLKVELAANHLSDPYQVPAQASWKFGRTTGGTGDQRKFEVLGSGKSAGTAAQLVILFRKGPKNSDGFRVVSFADGPAVFGDRQLFFLNLSKRPVAGEIGTVKFALKPARHIVISPQPDAGNALCHASLLLMDDGDWRPFMTSNWPLKKNSRGLIFIYSDPGSTGIRLHTIRDFPEAAPGKRAIRPVP